MSAAQYLNLGFELADPSAWPHELFRFLRRHPGNLASVNAVLLDPVVEGGGRDVEIVGSLRD